MADTEVPDVVRLARAATMLGVTKTGLRKLLSKTGRTTYTQPGGVVEFVKLADLAALFPGKFHVPGEPEKVSAAEAAAIAVARLEARLEARRP